MTGAAVVLITHDLGVVAGNADRVAVMYAGRIVETAPVEPLFREPVMPYTIGLLRSMPNMTAARTERLVPLEGRPPLLTQKPTGCPFADRCPAVIDACRDGEPALIAPTITQAGAGAITNAGGDTVADIATGAAVSAPAVLVDHTAACIRRDEIAAGTLERSEIFPGPTTSPTRRSTTATTSSSSSPTSSRRSRSPRARSSAGRSARCTRSTASR